MNQAVTPFTYQCPDCDWTGTIDALGGLLHLHHIDEHISAGELVPAGTCPECRALIEVETPDIPALTFQIMAWAMRSLGWTVIEPVAADQCAAPARSTEIDGYRVALDDKVFYITREVEGRSLVSTLNFLVATNTLTCQSVADDHRHPVDHATICKIVEWSKQPDA